MKFINLYVFYDIKDYQKNTKAFNKNFVFLNLKIEGFLVLLSKNKYPTVIKHLSPKTQKGSGDITP